MRVGLGILDAAGPRWPDGASYLADFVSNRYMRDGDGIPAGAAFSVQRASSKFAPDRDGNFVAFAPDTPALTNRGLCIEAAASNVLTRPVNFSNWLAARANAIATGSPLLNIFSEPVRVSDTEASIIARIRHPEIPVQSGQSYALSIWLRTGSSGAALVMCTNSAGSSRITFDLGTAAIISDLHAGGTMSLESVVAWTSTVSLARLIWTPNATGNGEVAVGPGTGIIGHWVDILGAFMEPGAVHSTPMVANGVASTRSADIAVLALPAGAHDLTLTFDDRSTQSLAGASGNFVLPTNLDRPVIRSVLGFPA